MTLPPPANELQRLAALRSYGILDTSPEDKYDDIAVLAAEICGTPISAITLLDETRQWFKSKVGLNLTETSREIAFCNYTLDSAAFLMVADATKDERFANNPLVTGETGVRFYAGSPLITPTGETLGTLCVLDHVPRNLNEKQINALQVLSRNVMEKMELRRQVEEQKRMTELLQAAQQIAAMGSWEQDLLTNRLTWSTETCHLFGIEPADFGGTLAAFLEFVLPEDRPSLEAMEFINASLLEVLEVEYRICRPDGQIRWLAERGKLVCDESGKPARRLGMVMDITERKRADEALRTSEDRFRSFMAHNPAAAWIVDEEGVFRYVSPGYYRMFGVGDTDITNRKITEFYEPRLAKAYLANNLIVHRDKKTIESLEPGINNEGQPGEFLVIKFPILRAEGKTWVGGVALDVTDRKRAERERDRLFNLSEDLLVVANFNGRFDQLNPAWTKCLGWSLEELTSEESINFVLAEDRGITLVMHQGLKDGRPLMDFENRYRCKDGSFRWLSWRCHSLPELGQFFGIARDVTERKVAGEDLRKSEERYRAFFDKSPLGIATGGSIFKTVNQRYCDIVGYSREEVMQMHFSDFTHPEDVNSDTDQIKRLLAGEIRHYTLEKRFIRKDCAVVWVSLTVVALWNSQEEPAICMAVVEDITERKLSRDRLIEQAALLDSAHEAILVKDLQDHIIYWNKGAERTYGWTAEDALGKKAADLLRQDEAAYHNAHTVLMEKGQFNGETLMHTREGRPLMIETRCTLVRDEQGTPKSILALNNDITDKKKLEAQFLRAQRMDSIGTLAGGIAHDLNNMLAPIMMSLEILKMKFPDQETSSLLDTLQNSAQRGANLVKQVLSFARGVEGQRVVVNPLRLMDEIQKFAQDTFPKSIVFNLKTQKDLWNVIGDSTQIHQVFLNLCVNARDAMSDGGRLDVSLENVVFDATYAAMNPDIRPGRYILVEMADTGSGIPQPIRDKIFEPFFTTKEFGKGTGLGLSTSMAIVKSHGGFIQLYSEVGSGTKFLVYLPADTSDAMAAETALEQTRLPAGRGEWILVVDDEESIRQTVQVTLERFGYRIILASHGAEAVALYASRRREIAAVLTDMNMPIMDGASCIIALRGINPDIKIIGSSGLSSQAGVAKAIGAGLQYYMAKPYTAEALLKKLREVLAA